MADKSNSNDGKPSYAKSSVKSGNTDMQYAERVLDGFPTKKDVEEIEKVNLPSNVKGSASQD